MVIFFLFIRKLNDKNCSILKFKLENNWIRHSHSYKIFEIKQLNNKNEWSQDLITLLESHLTISRSLQLLTHNKCEIIIKYEVKFKIQN